METLKNKNVLACEATTLSLVDNTKRIRGQESSNSWDSSRNYWV